MAPARPLLFSAFLLPLLSFGLLGALHVAQGSEVDTEGINIDDYRFSILHKDHKASSFRTNWNSNYDRLKHYTKNDRKRLSHFSSQMRKFAPVSGKATTNTVGISLSNGFGQYGGYYISIYISSKKLLQYLIYDTGSDLVWVQCKECGDQCYSQTNDPYSLISSSSSKNVSCLECRSVYQGSRCLQNKTCTFSAIYGDQSQISGILAKERFNLKLFKKNQYIVANDIIFGCVTQSENFDLISGDPNVDGIAGFGVSPLSFPAQVARKLNQKNAFSACLVSNSLLDDSQLKIGSSALAHSNVSYTPILKKPKSFNPYFYVQVLNVSINNKVLDIPKRAWNFDLTRPYGGTFLDSGTTNIFLTKMTFQPIVDSIKSLLVGKLEPVTLSDFSDFSLCYYFVIQDVSDLNNYFPPITFIFQNNVKVTLLGYQYVTQVSTWVVCSAFQLNPDDFNVLGGIFQQDQLIVHNVEALKIGFKPMDCAKGKPR